mmetsp:Transcript_70836/g.207563  ORF Transcript_70836/g.207563 Transcript_70836/m.207563 type:complete len:928 (-) Transcript_70836:59-2842(-)
MGATDKDSLKEHRVSFNLEEDELEQEDGDMVVMASDPMEPREGASSRNVMAMDNTSSSGRLKTINKQRFDFRIWLMGTTWYRSIIAMRMRTLLQGKKVACAMILALFTALFLPDIWVILGCNSSVEIDMVLSMVLVLFALEAVSLGATDAMYLFSFFHVMDILGTFSIIFDISYLLGDQACEPHMVDKSLAEWQLLLMKGMSFGRVGARAGRLSRVLRIFRFLPCFEDHSQGHGGIAMVISNQLGNMMATQVASLTIILVMVIPLFNILNFPQNDFSLETWVEYVSEYVKANDMEGANIQLGKMAAFFERHTYGPFLACQGGATGGEVFMCEKQLTDWTPLIGEPTRKASVLLVKSDVLMVGFNMQDPIAKHAGINLGTTVFIVLVMLFSGLVLTSTVTELAVRPLERMLNTVREIASTVFKFEGEEQQEDEVEDINSASEMILLEKVVEKLANIASLQTKDEGLHTIEDMEDEDLAVLGLMQGRTVTIRSSVAPIAIAPTSEGNGGDRPSTKENQMGKTESTFTKTKSKSELRPEDYQQPVAAQMKLEDFGLNEENVSSWAFQALSLTEAQQSQLAVYVISSFHDAVEGEGFIRTTSDLNTLQKFVTACEKEYPPNAFHSFSHAIDVVHMVSKMLRNMGSDLFLSELEQYTLLVSALGHDLGHPGVNNGFLSETSHELAMQYNDRSPLENMHCAKLYSIVKNPETNCFKMFTKDQYKEARKQTIESILHTDMMGHQSMVKELQIVYQVNSEVFTPQVRGRKSLRSTRRSSHLKSTLGTEVDVFNQSEIKILTIDCVLHSADVSNSCRTWEVTREWAWRVLEEFFAQGDQEKALGVPVQFLNDRDKLNRPNSQIGFIEFMIAPFFAAQIRLWPGLRDLGDNLSNNIRNWEDLWVEEVDPPSEERDKVSARVLKVTDSLEAAAMRAPP